MPLWELAIAISALVSGFMAMIVAFLLYLKHRHPAMIRFVTFVANLELYAALNMWSFYSLPRNLTRVEIEGLESLFYFLALQGASMSITVGDFFLAFLGMRRSLLTRFAMLFPSVMVALAVPLFVLRILPFWTDGPLVQKGIFFWLFAELLVFVVLTIRAYPTIMDRFVRLGLRVTGVIVLFFIPLWILETLEIIRTWSFIFFLLVWNGASIVIAGRAFFMPEPRPEPALGALADAALLEGFASRFGLTAREREIVARLTEGRQYQEIADELCISGKTVRNHISNIYAKTGAKSRLGLVHLIRNAS